MSSLSCVGGSEVDSQKKEEPNCPRTSTLRSKNNEHQETGTDPDSRGELMRTNAVMDSEKGAVETMRQWQLDRIAYLFSSISGRSTKVTRSDEMMIFVWDDGGRRFFGYLPCLPDNVRGKPSVHELYLVARTLEIVTLSLDIQWPRYPDRVSLGWAAELLGMITKGKAILVRCRGPLVHSSPSSSFFLVRVRGWSDSVIRVEPAWASHPEPWILKTLEVIVKLKEHENVSIIHPITKRQTQAHSASTKGKNHHL